MTTRSGPLRVAMLAKGWTGFLDTSFRRLADRDVELFIAYPAGMKDTAYPPYAVHEYADVLRWESAPPVGELLDRIREFRPDAVLVHSWEVDAYRAVLKAHPEALRVLWMDNIWLGTPRQWMGRLTSRWYLHPLFDAAFVPSDRTEAFARRLGFGADAIIRGAWSADTGLFGAPERTPDELGSRRRFVSALRLVHHKGADQLGEAYTRYRTLTPEPWDLDIAGIGPLADTLSDIPGVHLHGFLAPEDLAALMHRSSCYINPSRQEPYGLVLHEAAAAGLPILSGDVIGAAPTMVQDGQNGWVFPGSDPAALADAMLRVSSRTPEELADMSRISRSLSLRISPDGWARHLHEEVLRRL